MRNVSRPRLTISVLAKNEAANIERCLNSASFADELIVIDGGSTDATVEKARACGAIVFVYSDWHGFAHQRNHQLTHTGSEYLLLLDADEEISPELRDEISALLSRRPQSVYGLKTLEVAFGKELRFAAPHKAYNRFFLAQNLQGFEGAVHENPVLKNAYEHGGFLTHPIRHVSKPTIHISLQKLAQYASLGADKRRATGKTGGILRGFLAGITSFIQMYIVKRNFTGGAAGFLYSLFIALEAFFRYVALKYDKFDEAGQAKR
jgi:glycosyltransferase involved in cell wall biosynthesis